MDAAATDTVREPVTLPIGMQPSTWAGIWVLVALAVLAGVRVSLRNA